MQKLLADTTISLTPAPDSGFSKLGTLTIPSLISGVIRLVIVVAAIIFFFVLVIGGIRWIASGGDKQQTENARNQITAALVGLVIVFAAWAILALIKVFFGVDIFTLTIPTV
jgi:TRAP-type C4-dicarboxylate transport system permease small subunit